MKAPKPLEHWKATLPTLQLEKLIQYKTFRFIIPGYGYPAVSTSTEFIDATTGFAVTPRLTEQHPISGEQQVILDVSPWSDNVNVQGQIESQNVQSTIKINLGQWVELGGIDEDSHSSANGNLATIRQTNQNRAHILVKVDKAD